MVTASTHEVREAKEELARRAAKKSFKAFMKAHPPEKPYLWGTHTERFCQELQNAVDRYKRGESTYLMINVPPRHGKSDCCSRRFPVWFLLNNPDKKVMLSSCNQPLADEMSIAARKCMREVGPDYGINIAHDRSLLRSWEIEDSANPKKNNGVFQAAGIQSGVAGKGADCLIIDDYIRGRADADSEKIRNKVWDGFQSDLVTRLAPVHIVVILATRWHEDDLGGRIIRRMKEQEEFPKEDQIFPKYKVVRLPAQNDDGSYLFPERFSKAYYEGCKSGGKYKWSCLYQNNPTPRSGNRIKTSSVEIINEAPAGLVWRRGWDLASSEDELDKDDPDYTVGVKSAFKDGILYIGNVVRGQWEAPERDKRMEQTARIDGRGCHQAIEVVAGYKDTYTRIKKTLEGFAIVEKYTPDGDKIARAAILEGVFEGGCVKLVRGDWNYSYLAEMGSFPSGTKDDQVDATVISAMGWLDDFGAPFIMLDV